MSNQYVVISRTNGTPLSQRVSRALAADIAASLDGIVVPDALTLRLWQPRPDSWTVTVLGARGVGYLQAGFDRAWAAELFARALAGQWKADRALDVTVERQVGQTDTYQPLDTSGSEPMLSQTSPRRWP